MTIPFTFASSEFDTRYVSLPEYLAWEITNGKFILHHWNMTNGSIEELKKKCNSWLSQNNLNSWSDEAKSNPEYQKMQTEIVENTQKLKEIMIGVLQPICIDRLQKVFKTKDFYSLSGLSGYFEYKKEISKGKNFGYVTLAIDTKKKVFCLKDGANYKIVDGDIELRLSDDITITNKSGNGTWIGDRKLEKDESAHACVGSTILFGKEKVLVTNM